MDEPLNGPWELSVLRRNDTVTGYEISGPLPGEQTFRMGFSAESKLLVDYLMSVAPRSKPTP